MRVATWCSAAVLSHGKRPESIPELPRVKLQFFELRIDYVIIGSARQMQRSYRVPSGTQLHFIGIRSEPESTNDFPREKLSFECCGPIESSLSITKPAGDCVITPRPFRSMEMGHIWAECIGFAKKCVFIVLFFFVLLKSRYIGSK